MTGFRDVRQQLARHRICLERDTAAGLIPEAAFTAVDRCFADLAHLLDTARVEVEAAGPRMDLDFVNLFVGGCARLDREMFAAMYLDQRADRLARRALRLRREARALHEHLWLRIGLAAA